MKKISLGILAAVVLIVGLSSCGIIKIDREEKQKLDYTVVKEEDMPREIQALIEERKEQEFQMAYQSGNELSLVKGYGQQEGGGYSIQVEALSMTENALELKTKLLGPSGEEDQSPEPSYPYIVIKMEYRDLPVRFQS